MEIYCIQIINSCKEIRNVRISNRNDNYTNEMNGDRMQMTEYSI